MINYRMIRNYGDLKKGVIIKDDWDEKLLLCFRFLPYIQFQKLENFAHRRLLPTSGIDSCSILETEICKIFASYLYQNNFSEKILRRGLSKLI